MVDEKIYEMTHTESNKGKFKIKTPSTDSCKSNEMICTDDKSQNYQESIWGDYVFLLAMLPSMCVAYFKITFRMVMSCKFLIFYFYNFLNLFFTRTD